MRAWTRTEPTPRASPINTSEPPFPTRRIQNPSPHSWTYDEAEDPVGRALTHAAIPFDRIAKVTDDHPHRRAHKRYENCVCVATEHGFVFTKDDFEDGNFDFREEGGGVERPYISRQKRRND